MRMAHSSNSWEQVRAVLRVHANAVAEGTVVSPPPSLLATNLPGLLLDDSTHALRVDQQLVRWRANLHLLYVSILPGHVVVSTSLGQSAKSMLMATAWLRAACATHPRHRVLLVLLDETRSVFAYIGMTAPLSSLATLLLPQCDKASRPFYGLVDVLHDGFTLVPGAYIDPSEATLLEELTRRTRLHGAVPRTSTELVAPSFNLSRLESRIAALLTDDDSSNYLIDWFQTRQLAMLSSDGALHTVLAGEEDVSFGLVLLCVIARCLHGTEPTTLLRRRTLNVLLNFELKRMSAQLFQRCTCSGATEMLVRNDPLMRSLARAKHALDILEPADTPAPVMEALAESNDFYVRADRTTDCVFRYASAWSLLHTLQAHRGVLYRGALYVTYHDVPYVVSEMYALALEPLCDEAVSRYGGALPSLFDDYPSKRDYFQIAYEMARERFLQVQGRRVNGHGSRSTVALPDIEDLMTQAAPLCMVNSYGYLKSQGGLWHLSRVMLYRHLLDAGYQSDAVGALADKLVTDGSKIKNHTDLIDLEAKKLDVEHDRKCGCAIMYGAKWDKDSDSRGCPYNELDERNLAALLLASGMAVDNPALPKILNKALGHGEAQGVRHPRAACAMHATARIRSVIGPQPYDSTTEDRGLPFDSPAGYVHHVLAAIQQPLPVATPMDLRQDTKSAR